MINKLINFGKVLVIPLVVIIFTPLILAILNLIGLKTYDVSLLIIMMITALVTGFISGRKTEKKGYLNGIVLGAIICLMMFIFSLIFENSYKLDTLIYYLIIIAATTVGSMFGIQKNIKK